MDRIVNQNNNEQGGPIDDTAEQALAKEKSK
jgi:hypothetical protein